VIPIRIQGATVTYAGAERPALEGVDLEVEEGHLCVVAGPTGSGKSTLLGLMTGMVPHFTGGRLDGRVLIDGRDTRSHPPRELADVVGRVGQDPLAGFVADRVDDELAYGMEQLAVPPATMRTRVEQVLDLLGIAELRNRPLRTLSGGEQQRVAIGAALAVGPRILVLDEPTSALDPTAAEEVLAAITRVVHDLGLTVVIAEHRLERVIGHADQIVHVHSGRVDAGAPEAILRTMRRVPPIVELARLAGWSPTPLTIRDARRHAASLRRRLPSEPRRPVRTPAEPAARPGAAVAVARGVSVTYRDLVAVRAVDLDVRSHEVTVLMGRNGSGKSSLLWALQGAGARRAGSVAVRGQDPAALDPAAARRVVGLVPQTPSDLIYGESVAAECAQADRESAAAPGTCQGLLSQLLPGIDGDRHPRDLSEGQRLALVLAIQLSASPSLVLLDEPTRGLDYAAKARLAAILQALAAEGRAVMLATHDVEFAAIVADRVVVMAEAEVVADEPARELLTASPAFAPQVARILSPGQWLTVAEVAAHLDEDAADRGRGS
jgi:energy-coupling factor transport system ATP-binding protein